MSPRELIERSVQELSEVYDSREARNIIETLLLDAHGLNKTELILDQEINIGLHAFESQLDRLKNHEPVQYVTGIAQFYGREFKVNKDVLIPRPETEELVDWIIQENQKDSPIIWDIGAGSGCIALSLAAEITGSKVFAIDVSEQAMKVASENSERFGVKSEFIIKDILSEIPAITEPDIILSNPPYIPDRDKSVMSANVLDYEPEVALFVTNDDPLIFYRRIAEIGMEKLNSRGSLYFEIHEEAGEAVVEIMESLGYSDVELRKDLQGKDRMVRGRISPNQT